MRWVAPEGQHEVGKVRPLASAAAAERSLHASATASDRTDEGFWGVVSDDR
jgi:hypothetical protein